MKHSTNRIIVELTILTLTIVTLVMTCIVAAGIHHHDTICHTGG